MNKLQLVKSEHFGEVQADIYSNGDEMFMTINQLTECLEYADKRAIEKLLERNPYLKNEEFSYLQKVPYTAGGTQNTRTFTEDGIYEVTMLSSQPKAKEFRTWIRSILKGLRTGTIKLQQSNPLAKDMAEAKLLNARARAASQWLKMGDCAKTPEYQQICYHYASGVLAGHEVLPLPERSERYYTATELGEMFGVSAQKIGSITNREGLKTDAYGKWYHDKSRYSSKEVDTFKYNDKAIDKLKEILM